MMKTTTLTLILLAAVFALNSSAEQCGKQANGASCPGNNCCSNFGWCGTTSEYCSPAKCQSQCHSTTTPVPSPPGGNTGGGGVGVDSILTEAIFNQLLKYRNDNRCSGPGFYKYSSFIAAAKSFSGFGTTGDLVTRKRELAAFLAQTSHETTGGWASAPDGPYAWGYCFINERNNPPAYCSTNQWPCPAGKKYYGRGPIQLTHNYNYGQAGRAIGADLINNPDLVATDATVSFKTAVWFWMTPQGSKPSSHSVIIGQWKPSNADKAANRVAGYGVITNIINGGLECGHGQDNRVQDRIGFYKRYCDILGVSYGDNLDCNNQRPFS